MQSRLILCTLLLLGLSACDTQPLQPSDDGPHDYQLSATLTTRHLGGSCADLEGCTPIDLIQSSGMQGAFSLSAMESTKGIWLAGSGHVTGQYCGPDGSGCTAIDEQLVSVSDDAQQGDQEVEGYFTTDQRAPILTIEGFSSDEGFYGQITWIVVPAREFYTGTFTLRRTD